MSIAGALYSDEKRFDSMLGVAVGIVTNIDDPENLGRLKVKLIARDSSEFETDFIRILTPMSGKQWGMFYFPEIGDEVLVAFANGEMARPYVLGSLWNQNYKPPVKMEDGKNIKRKIKTKNGHEFTFTDEDDKNSIELKTPNGLTLFMDDEKEVIKLKDKDGKNMLQIDSKNGVINIDAEKKIVLKTGNATLEMDGNANSILLESSQSLKLKSQQISIESKGEVKIKASANVNIKSDGPLSMKGAVIKAN